MILVPLSVAKSALHLVDPGRDPEFQAALEHASDVVYKRIDVRADPTWTELTAPPVVQRATIIVMGLLLNNLGDIDDDRAAKTWAHVDELLKQTRDPAMA